jgi:hypothetical protein
MNQQKIKKTYLTRIQKILESVNVFFNLSELNVDDFTEEALFMECWEMEQMYACSNNKHLHQLYKLWCSRVEEIQSIQLDDAMP